jgi:hypothetical protein
MHNQLRNAQTALSQESFRFHTLSGLQGACLLGCCAERQSRDITLYLT